MKFAENFWNSEICNFTGFDILCQRMKDGRKVCKEYADFLRQRAQVQELFGKALVKLSKSLGGKEEIGSLRQAWEIMRTETENIGQEHIAAAGSMIEESNKIYDLLEKRKAQRKQVEEQLRRTQMSMKSAMRKVQETKKTYYTRCKEKEVLEETLQSIELGRNAAQNKELEKLTQKQHRAHQAVENSNLAYCCALETLESIHQLWECEMQSTSECFQKLEEERIDFMRNSMWLLTNISSLQCVREDDMNENIRTSLENCTVDGDIELFIQSHQTGTTRPDHVTYEAYQSQNKSNGAPCPYRKEMNDQSPESEQSLAQSLDIEVNNSIYESVNSDKEFDEVLCKVLYDFTARDETEISLEAGDVVKVMNACDPDWWQVRTEDDRMGYFPVIYMEILEDESD